MRRPRYATLLAACLLLTTLTACSVEVSRGDEGGNATVEVDTPAGGVSVRANEPVDTGLPVYPGATVVRRDRGETESANVDVSAFGIGVRVAAGKYESGDGQEKVVAFYRDAMRTYGTVVECEGEVDFKRDGAVCKPSVLTRTRQLAVGREGDQRLVVVEPRGGGSEISLVHVRVGG